MQDYLNLGPTPCNEDCVQVGEEDYPRRAKDECRRYIELLERRFPEVKEIPGASFDIKAFPHDFGTYYEVCVFYDYDEARSTDFAFFVEENLPEHWCNDEVLKMSDENE